MIDQLINKLTSKKDPFSFLVINVKRIIVEIKLEPKNSEHQAKILTHYVYAYVDVTSIHLVKKQILKGLKHS